MARGRSFWFFACPLACVVASPAWAEDSDWRFCVAADYRIHVAYLTPPFESAEAGKQLEAQVGALLDEKKLPYQNVQCRLGAELPAALTQRSDAETFIKALGFKLRHLK